MTEVNRDYLFRGVSRDTHESGNGLRPKTLDVFSYGAKYGEASYGTGWTYGSSERNAATRHQLNQEGWPTSGISTTPIYDRAVFYATGGGQRKTGYVYKIIREALSVHGVREVIVSECTSRPSVLADQEVILVVSPGSSLPDAVVECAIEVNWPPSTEPTSTGEKTFELDASLEAELLVSMSEGDRGQTVPADQILQALRDPHLK